MLPASVLESEIENLLWKFILFFTNVINMYV